MKREWMNSLSVCLMLILCPSFDISYGEAANPCTNGGFELLDERGFPVDWQAVGQTVEVTNDAHSGKYALRMKRTADTEAVETGLNRDWQLDSGERGAMLSQLKGGITFWYKAISAESATLYVYIIPMSAKPVEDTGEPRVPFTIPESHIGDGEWHKAAVKYDFTKSPKVKYVHISPRIVGKAGEFLLDDVSFVEKVGPQLIISKVTLVEQKGREGEECEVSAIVKNAGDVAAKSVEVTITTPEHLKVRDGKATQAMDTVAPDESATAKWKLSGRRQEGDRLLVIASSEKSEASGAFDIKSVVTLVHLRPERFILTIDEKTNLECLLANEGHTIAEGISATISAPKNLRIVGGPTRKLGRLRPGKKALLKWTVRAIGEPKTSVVSVEVSIGKEKIGSAQTSFVFTTSDPRNLRPSNRLRAAVEKSVGVLENSFVRLLCLRSEQRIMTGYSLRYIIELQAKRRGSWRTVAKMPHLSRIVWLDDSGERQEETPHAVYLTRPDYLITPIESENTAALKLTAKLKDAGGAIWSLEFAFSLKEGEKVISARYQAESDRPRKLLCFEGPVLYVGEGGFGDKKKDAIFPGLEWLVDGEISSSSLDIAEDHPHRIRYVPHPNMVTIPAMGVHWDGVTTGLLWDIHQKWDGKNDRPSAVFASPNYFEHRNGHLLGLFVPSIPEWVKANDREATTPYDLAPNKPLTIDAKILLDGEAKDSLAAIDKWFDIYGVPDPMPIPRGSYKREVEFSMKAYLESLWVPEEEQWWTTRGAGALLSHKGRPNAFCFDLLMGATITDDDDLRRRCLDRLQRVLEITRGRPIGDDMGFGARGGRVEDHLMRMAAGPAGLIASMGKDGEWRFDADKKGSGVFKGKDYHLLGKDDAAELGTCARRAYEVLRYARMRGDRRAFKAGKKSLKFMERFTVPRAAQVWEVPVHTPDILAASDAVDAYVEAYRYSNDRRYLDQAVRWARAGLPFLYVWNTPEFPFMRYGSIPVFGATWFRGSWFGRPVQWNGLRFSYALLKLWDYDQSFPWKKIAEGIVISAMYQQATEEEDIALWPDSISAIDGKKSAWIFGPQLILKVVYKLIGRDAEPQTAIVGSGDKRVHINSGADISNVFMSRSNELRFDLTYPKGESGYTLISCIDRPTKVLLNEVELAENENLEEGDSPGWRYDSGYAFLTIRLTSDGKSAIFIEGAKHRYVPAIPRLVNKIDFRFDHHTQGWAPANAITNLGVTEGVLRGTATGPDPYLTRSSVKVEGNKCKTVVIRMKVSAGAGGQFYWTTADSPVFAEDKTARFPIAADGEFHDYRLDVGKDPMWAGKRITALRIDPTNGAPGATFEIDYVKGE